VRNKESPQPKLGQGHALLRLLPAGQPIDGALSNVDQPATQLIDLPLQGQHTTIDVHETPEHCLTDDISQDAVIRNRGDHKLGLKVNGLDILS
jgi:hypothetical protein